MCSVREVYDLSLDNTGRVRESERERVCVCSVREVYDLSLDNTGNGCVGMCSNVRQCVGMCSNVW